MKHVRILSFACLLSILMAIFLVQTGISSAAPASQCGSWQLVSSPNTKAPTNELLAITAISSKDIWAVGYIFTRRYGRYPLTEHWNGSTWSIVPTPDPKGNILSGVSADASNDVWAIGSTRLGHGNSQPLINHWNGSRWSIAPAPNMYAVNGIAAIAPNNVWVVGYGNAPTYKALIEQWNGTSWNNISGFPFPSQYSSLSAITSLSANDIWTVGNYSNKNNSFDKTFSAHWDGSTWTLILAANRKVPYNTLGAVSADATNDVWATGFTESVPGTTEQVLIEHWNGSTWTIVPSRDDTKVFLGGIAAIFPDNVWAVGNTIATKTAARTFIEHWNGTTWSVVHSPNVGSLDNVLFGVTRVPGQNTVWTAGYYTVSLDVENTLTETYC